MESFLVLGLYTKHSSLRKILWMKLPSIDESSWLSWCVVPFVRNLELELSTHILDMLHSGYLHVPPPPPAQPLVNTCLLQLKQTSGQPPVLACLSNTPHSIHTLQERVAPQRHNYLLMHNEHLHLPLYHVTFAERSCHVVTPYYVAHWMQHLRSCMLLWILFVCNCLSVADVKRECCVLCKWSIFYTPPLTGCSSQPYSLTTKKLTPHEQTAWYKITLIALLWLTKVQLLRAK